MTVSVLIQTGKQSGTFYCQTNQDNFSISTTREENYDVESSDIGSTWVLDNGLAGESPSKLYSV